MDNDHSAAHGGREREVTTSEGRRDQLLDRAVAFKWIAAPGALSAAVAPAVMATAGGDVLRGSVSAYWNIDPQYIFWLPFTFAAALLLVDGVLSYTSSNRAEFGSRWYNLLLGVSLLLLTWFDKDNYVGVHYTAAVVFFSLFIAVIVYTSFLGWTGRLIDPGETDDDAGDRLIAEVSLVFLLLLALTLAAWAFGLVTFFFFEIFALVNFALYYVQGSLRAFPYVRYEFRIDWLNTLFRAIYVMRR